MVALNFTDEVVYKNTHPVCVFIGVPIPAKSARAECRIRLLLGCDNLMCSLPRNRRYLGSYLNGKMPANAIVLGASHSRLREGPAKQRRAGGSLSAQTQAAIDEADRAVQVVTQRLASSPLPQ
jgi:hypothetical protein